MRTLQWLFNITINRKHYYMLEHLILGDTTTRLIQYHCKYGKLKYDTGVNFIAYLEAMESTKAEENG